MNKSLPLVSVIIPTYNRGRRVVRAIESALAQTYPKVQIIIVDDGSIDDTEEIVSAIAGVEYIKIEQNGGQAAARNAGLAQAKGVLIASLDSDDHWLPEFLEKCVQHLVDSDLDFVFANWNQAYVSGNWGDFLSRDSFLMPHFKWQPKKDWYLLEGEQLRALYLKACPSPSSSVVMRRSSIVDGWNKQTNIGDDWCLYLDMILTKKCRVAFTLERLWYKDIDGLNIYDGRSRVEVVRLLLISDTKLVLDRYQQLLSPAERKVLERRYVAGLVEEAKHVALRERNPRRGFLIFWQGVKKDASCALVTAVKLCHEGVMNQLTSFLARRRERKFRVGPNNAA